MIKFLIIKTPLYFALILFITTLCYYLYSYFIQYHVVVYLAIVCSAPIAFASVTSRISISTAVGLFWAMLTSTLLLGITFHSLVIDPIKFIYNSVYAFNYVINFTI